MVLGLLLEHSEGGGGQRQKGAGRRRKEALGQSQQGLLSVSALRSPAWVSRLLSSLLFNMKKNHSTQPLEKWVEQAN